MQRVHAVNADPGYLETVTGVIVLRPNSFEQRVLTRLRDLLGDLIGKTCCGWRSKPKGGAGISERGGRACEEDQRDSLYNISAAAANAPVLALARQPKGHSNRHFRLFQDGAALGTPSFSVSGGGANSATYNSSYVNQMQKLFACRVPAFREITHP